MSAMDEAWDGAAARTGAPRRFQLLLPDNIGVLTRRKPPAPTAPIFLQQSDKHGLLAEVDELPGGDLNVSNYRLIVRQETDDSRPRVRAIGCEPFICPEAGFNRVSGGAAAAGGAGGGRRWGLRIRFPKAGYVTPMTASCDRCVRHTELAGEACSSVCAH